MAVPFLANTPHRNPEIVNFVDPVFPSSSIPTVDIVLVTTEEKLQNGVTVYGDKFARNSLINLVKEFPTL